MGFTNLMPLYRYWSFYQTISAANHSQALFFMANGLLRYSGRYLSVLSWDSQ